MERIKYLAVLAICGLLSLPLSACGNVREIAEYQIPETMQTIETGLIAENEHYLLKWDDEQKSALLENKATGYIWSTVPYEFLKEGGSNVNLNSPLFIQYYSPYDGSLQTSKAYSDCIMEETLEVTQVDGGVKLTFYFLDAEVTIPLYITLRENSLRVSVPLSEIVESGKTELRCV